MKVTLSVMALFAIGWLLLLTSGTRVLVSETKVEPGQVHFVENYGDLGQAKQASLVCRYFTGKGMTQSVFWYSPNNVLGRDECPFTIRP